MRFTSLATTSALAAIALLGAGCAASKTPSQTAATSTDASAHVASPVSNHVEIIPKKPADELKDVLDAFRAVKTFRVKYAFPSNNGSVSTTLSFVRPDRFQGTMQVDGKEPVDVVVIANSMYMRLPQVGWMDLTGTPSAAATGDALEKAINGQTSLGNLGIDSDSNVQKTTDAIRHCDLFSATLHGQDGSAIPLKICAVDSLPKYVDIDTKNGAINFEYYDYNKVFLIERPPLQR